MNEKLCLLFPCQEAVNQDKMAVIHFAEAGRHVSSVAKRLKREMPDEITFL